MLGTPQQRGALTPSRDPAQFVMESSTFAEARIAVFSEVFRDILEVSERLHVQVQIRKRGNQEFPRGAVL